MAKNAKEVEIAAGVVRDAEISNPLIDNSLEKKQRSPGKWIKVTQNELIKYQDAGRLVGYDPSTSEVLLN